MVSEIAGYISGFIVTAQFALWILSLTKIIQWQWYIVFIPIWIIIFIVVWASIAEVLNK